LVGVVVLGDRQWQQGQQRCGRLKKEEVAMTFNQETAPSGTHPVLATMIDRPAFAMVPFLAFLVVGMVWKVNLFFTLAFLYQGVWCVFRNARCGTPHCGITGPLLLLIAFVSLLRWVPPFASSASAWSSWDHLIPVAWMGTTAAFAAQWVSRPRSAASSSAFISTMFSG
jgi:hypothetical protein